MADQDLVPAAAAVSPEAKAKAEAAAREIERERGRSMDGLAVWANELLVGTPPARPVLLATSQPKSAPDGELVVEPGAAWMPAGRLCLLVSPGGRGKTAVLLSLAAHVAAGEKWCGLHVVRPGAVALVFGEEDRDELHRRLDASMPVDARARETAARRMLVLPLAGTGNNRLVDETPGQGAERSERATELLELLRKRAPKGGWSLVVVDPFARFAGMDAEKDNASATETMTVLEELTTLPGGPSVLVAHHTRKGADKDDDQADLVRGSSAIRDSARWVGMLRNVVLSDGNNGLKLEIVKSNYTRQDQALELSTDAGIVTGGCVTAAAGAKGNGKAAAAKAEGNGKVAAGARRNERQDPDR